MQVTTWLTVAAICALGAMSPGPSLAVVLRHTVNGGRSHGCTAAITHAAGIGIYALLCVSGLALVITASPRLFSTFQWAGAAYLAWLGIQGLRARPPASDQPPSAPTTSSAARDGFLIVFLNPKVAVFFIALFSQVIGAETSWLARLGYAATAWFIDLTWYLLVAWMFSTPRWLAVMQRQAIWFERLFGLILLALAVRLVAESL